MPKPQSHPWLERLWVRILIVAMLVVALTVEFLYLKETLWLFLWGGALIYALWDFFLRRVFDKPKG